MAILNLIRMTFHTFFFFSWSQIRSVERIPNLMLTGANEIRESEINSIN